MKVINDFILVKEKEEDIQEGFSLGNKFGSTIELVVVSTSQDDIPNGSTIKTRVTAPKKAHLEGEQELMYVRRADVIMIL